MPAKSAEFAHPDITLGLTVMAYRYSGLRDGDFSDMVDALSSEFSHEIGPARERASSLQVALSIRIQKTSLRFSRNAWQYYSITN